MTGVKKGVLSITVCYVMWGAFPLMWRALGATPPAYVLASRLFWSLLVTVIVLFFQKKWPQFLEVWRDKKLMLRVALPGAIISFNWFLIVFAVNNGRALDSTLGGFMNTLACCVAGIVFFHELPNRVQSAAILMAVAGIVLMAVQYGRFPWIAVLISTSFGIYSAMKKGVEVDPMVALTYECVIMVPLALPAMLWMEATGQGALANLAGWRLALVPMMGIITVYPLMLYARGINLLPLSLAGFLQYISSVGAFLIAVFIFKETFTIAYAVGYGFIWSSLVVFTIGSFLPHKPPSALPVAKPASSTVKGG